MIPPDFIGVTEMKFRIIQRGIAVQQQGGQFLVKHRRIRVKHTVFDRLAVIFSVVDIVACPGSIAFIAARCADARCAEGGGGGILITYNQMQSGFFLNIIVSKCSIILQSFTCKDQFLVCRQNAFFVLDFSFYIFNCIGRLDIKRDGFPTYLHVNKNLHRFSRYDRAAEQSSSVSVCRQISSCERKCEGERCHSFPCAAFHNSFPPKSDFHIQQERS